MIKVQGKIPKSIAVACSGGVDSLAVAHFLKANTNREVRLIHIHHNTSDSEAGLAAVRQFSPDVESFTIGEITKNLSMEEFWRNERYKIFHSLNMPVVTAHTLNDCVETWVWSSLHGNGKIIPYANKNVIRPFRLTSKSQFYDYAEKHKIEWYEDKSNNDISYIRNYIRINLMPHALKVNPGLEKVIRKKVIASMKEAILE